MAKRSAAQKAATRRMIAANRRGRTRTRTRTVTRWRTRAAGRASSVRRHLGTTWYSATGTAGGASAAYGLMLAKTKSGQSLPNVIRSNGLKGLAASAKVLKDTLNPFTKGNKEVGSDARGAIGAGVVVYGVGKIGSKIRPVRRIANKFKMKLDRHLGVRLLPGGR